jgi:hypothetical protein
MTDLEIAKSELYEENLKLVIVKNSKVLFSTKSNRISGFLDAIDKFGNSLEGSSVADRVVGKAIALLCAYAKIKEIHAEILSRKAHSILKTNGILYHWSNMVDNILDASKTGICPFEKTATQITDPEKAFKTFQALREKLKSC